MKRDITEKIYVQAFNYNPDTANLNNEIKAVILDFGENYGGKYIVENDNFGTDRKYTDFTEGKKKAGLKPLQIVFAGLEMEATGDGEYIGADDQIHTFKELYAARNENK